MLHHFSHAANLSLKIVSSTVSSLLIMLLLSQHSRVAVASSRADYDRIVASVSDRLECQLRRLVSESMFGVNDYCGLATGPCDLKV